MIYVFVLTLAMLAVVNALIARSLLYPPVIFSALWSGLLFALALSSRSFYPISQETLMVYLVGAFVFSLGALVVSWLLKDFSAPAPAVSPRRRDFVRGVLNAGIVFLILMLPLYWGHLKQLSMISGQTGFWTGLRFQTSYGYGGGLGIYSYLVALSRFLALTAFYEKDGSRSSRWRAYILVGLALIYDLLLVARLGALLLIFGLAAISWLKAGKITGKSVAAAALVILLIFGGVAVVLGKGGSLDRSITANAYGILKTLRLYTLGGLAAFDQVVRAPLNFEDFRISTFRFFMAVANFFGANLDVPRYNVLYTWTPAPTNVYTIYFSYFLDFGWAGVAMIMFFLGGAAALIYRSAIRGNPQGAILYAVLVAALMVSNANEGFFTSLSYWIQAVVFTYLLYRWPPLPAIRKLGA